MNGAFLLAVGFELFGIVVVILFIIGVVAGKMREIGQSPPAGTQGPGDSRRIQEQIDEFLRRAGQRRGVTAAPVAEPVVAEVVDDDRVGGRVGKQVQKYLDTSDFGRRSAALGGEMVQADEQFTQQVGQTFGGDVGRLSARSAQATDSSEMSEAEVVEVEDPSRPTVEAAPSAGSGLGELMGSPDNIFHAVVMSEILRRPEW